MKNKEYNPEDAGNIIVNDKGKSTEIRKYHMTDKEMKKYKEIWDKEIENIDTALKEKAGKHFFNPYRNGIYRSQIKAMFLLGANEWHSFASIVKKMEEIMSKIPHFIKMKNGDTIENGTLWSQFVGKTERSNAVKCKSYVGRIQENMVFFQRLRLLHPEGYKLRQVFSAIDTKKATSSDGEVNYYFYRLSTYDNFNDAIPIRDFREFTLPSKPGSHISKKFVGKIITKNQTFIDGIEV